MSALERALDYFQGAKLTGDNVVLLVTDGGPNCNEALSCDIDQCTYNLDNPMVDCTSVVLDNNCCAVSGAHGCLDSGQTAAQVEQLADAGIGTIVVGLPGSEPYASLLDQLAVLGGQVASASEGYYRVDDLEARSVKEGWPDKLVALSAASGPHRLGFEAKRP